ncbi:Hypothetical_protein [Hexamita inflata]|uniref:Hypothetical_protein n=1 Tax=Hexamita inflata TaxID=28002 RepID=A0AA86UQW7_9EUKA|nr:Hypothetical protein HINF_LOCUS52139 [Hexamita inflata]
MKTLFKTIFSLQNKLRLLTEASKTYIQERNMYKVKFERILKENPTMSQHTGIAGIAQICNLNATSPSQTLVIDIVQHFFETERKKQTDEKEKQLLMIRFLTSKAQYRMDVETSDDEVIIIIVLF